MIDLRVVQHGLSKRARAVCALRTLAVGLLAIACRELPADLLVIAPPDFGAGTATIEIVVGTGIDRDSIVVEIDGEDSTRAFERTAEGLRGVVEIGAGAHRIGVRAPLADGSGERRHELPFTPPAALPKLASQAPAAGEPAFPTSGWIRLSGDSPIDPAALEAVSLSCESRVHPVRLHVVAERTLAIDPGGTLPPAAECTLAWRAPDGRGLLSFRTAPAKAGSARAIVDYDREDPRAAAPFPDDYWLATNPDDPTEQRLRIGLTGFGLPDQWLINALESGVRELDGFSPIGHITLPLSVAADPTSLPHGYDESLDPLATVWLVDVTPADSAYGTRIPFRVEARTEQTTGAPQHALLLFPSISLSPRHQYGVVVTNRVLATTGQPFEASPFFALARHPEAAPDASWTLRRVRALTEPVLTAVTAAELPPGLGALEPVSLEPVSLERVSLERLDVAFAGRFTIRSLDDIGADLSAIRRLIHALPSPAIRIERVTPEARSEVAAGSAVAAIVRGSWRAVDWRLPKGQLARTPEGTPRWTRTVDLPFVLALPRAAARGPVPVVIYQHGNPGSAVEEVARAARRSLAEAGFAVIGFTDTLNREASPPGPGLPERSHRQVVDILLRLLATGSVPNHFLQTVADQLSFIRAIEGIAAIERFAVARPGGGVRRLRGIDSAQPLLYLGVSEGAHHGTMLLPFAPEIRAAALVSPGRRFSEVLIHQRSEQLLAPLAFLGFGKLSPIDVWVVLALIQSVFDEQDPHLYAPLLYREPTAVSPAERASLLVVEGLGDTLVPNHATRALARAFGPVPQLAPAKRHIAGLPTAPGPIRANVDAKTSAAFYQFVPEGRRDVAPTPGCASPPLSESSAREGHYCAQSARESFEQQRHFFESALEEPAPEIIDPVAR